MAATADAGSPETRRPRNGSHRRPVAYLPGLLLQWLIYPVFWGKGVPVLRNAPGGLICKGRFATRPLWR
eukprot:4471883-Alexandrium_andersonii.AAC.1